MDNWKPITDSEFDDLFSAEYAELDEAQRKIFEQFRIPFWKATIRRSEMYGDEVAFIVSQKDDGVLYFDDVEYGFNISTVDNEGKILDPGGSTYTLQEAIERWFPKNS